MVTFLWTNKQRLNHANSVKEKNSWNDYERYIQKKYFGYVYLTVINFQVENNFQLNLSSHDFFFF